MKFQNLRAYVLAATLRDFAICLSLSNLCYLNVWQDVQRLQSNDLNYFRKLPLTGTLRIALCNVLLLSLALWVAITLVRRSQSGPAHKVAQCVFFLLLAVPIGIIETYLSQQSMAGFISRVGLPALKLAIVSGPAFILTRPNPIVPRMTRAIVLLLAPLFPVLLVHSAWLALRSPSPGAFHDKPLAPPLPDRGTAAPRIVWLVFDELDQRLAFLERPASLKLPELDSFRSQAIHGAQAYPPARWTLMSLPALISGKLVSQAEPAGPDQLALTLQETGEKASWSRQPSIFSRAREAGFNTALVGWYHPYCRLLNSGLTACWWQPYVSATGSLQREEYGRQMGFARGLLIQAGRQLSTIPLLARFGVAGADRAWRQESEWVRQQQRFAYSQVLPQALQAVTDPRFGLILVHWPIPHPEGFVNPLTGELAPDYNDRYFDNLALTDRTLRVLRLAMESAGLWERTTVLITSDHPLRNEARGKDSVGERARAATSSAESFALVPFLLKLGGQRQELRYDRPFNTVLTHDLLLALLRGELSSPETVLRWLDHNRARVPARSD